MTLSRTALGLASLIGLGIGFPGISHTQQYVTIPATLNQVTTRIPIPEDALRIRPDSTVRVSIDLTVDPAFYFCRSSMRASGLLDVSPAGMKLSLFNLLHDKSAAQLRTLINQIESDGDRVGKFGRMFYYLSQVAIGPRELADAYLIENDKHPVMGNSLSLDIMMRLRYGQEVLLPGDYACFTASQVDQVNAEGLRVMRAVLQQLSPGLSTSPQGQGAQKPVAPGIGVQRPQ